MIGRPSRESGQAAPLYITVVAFLLFLALAFFAVGQAGATRNSAQTAADAAALAAGQESRDLFQEDLLGGLLDPDFLEDIFNGDQIGTAEGCEAADALAAANNATVEGCTRPGGTWEFTVRVVTQQSMGESILSGTESLPGTAQATAIVEPRCDFTPAEDEETPPSAPPEEGGDEEPVSPGQLQCEGAAWVIDPENLGDLPDMDDLFSVHLSED